MNSRPLISSLNNFAKSLSKGLALSIAVFIFVGSQTTVFGQTDARPPSRDEQFKDLAVQAARVQHQYDLIKNVAKTVHSMVVHIEAKKKQSRPEPSGQSSRQSSFVEEAGSGIVIRHRGRNYIVTNFHVIENSDVSDIRIEADGQWFVPTRIVHDRATDLSVMFTERADLESARIGVSEKVEIGDFVIAVGSPFGLSHSVSYGIVSALGRRDLELGPQGVRFQDFIQTDAAINPGNSGGPLINLRGEVVGINTAIASNSGGSDGIGFSIPIDMAMRIATDLIDYGSVQRGFLGVSLDARFSPRKAIAMGLKRAYGARVSAITPSSPAANSEIEIGDIIIEYNGTRVSNDSHLVTEVSMTKIGTEVPVKVYRRGSIKMLKVKVGDRTELQPAS